VKARFVNPEVSGAAILAWMVKGCLDWQQHGLGEPGAVLLATEQYRKEMDPVGDFIDEHCEIETDNCVESAALFTRYKSWCEDNGESVFSRRQLANYLKKQGFEPYKGARGVRMWRGLALKSTVVRQQPTWSQVISRN
jgi:putative DNA primase/helicase